MEQKHNNIEVYYYIYAYSKESYSNECLAPTFFRPFRPRKFTLTSPTTRRPSCGSGTSHAGGLVTEKSPRRITPLRRYGAPAAVSTRTPRSASTRRQPDPRYMKFGAPVSMIKGMGTTRLSLISKGRTIAQRCRAGTSAYMIPKPTVYSSLGTGLR